ncbi:MAG: NADH-ubiquinone oxidoreductase subunit NDUFA12 family protein [Rickettsiales bacterium]|nr:NADH-ubiquinone oxidoreductase subunit NDUFA12 family protein [Rickettsiales bacterium]
MSFLTKLKIKFTCEKIGVDEFGNEYFQRNDGKRFIIYKGIAEASKIPASWHGWIHYNQNQPPINIRVNHYSWQKIHLPNLTGTKNSYAPKGHLACGGIREKVSSDYQAWHPDDV